MAAAVSTSSASLAILAPDLAALELLGVPDLATHLTAPQAQFLALLTRQAVSMGIDYRSIGLGWDHPTDRLTYREGNHPSIRRSQGRQEESRQALAGLANAIVAGQTGSESDVNAALVGAFLTETGINGGGMSPTFDGVFAALQGELLLPLRAFNEATEGMYKTFNGWPVPPDLVNAKVREISQAVVEGRYKDWRYTNPVGRHQLEGLSEAQVGKWMKASSTDFNGLRAHEDEDNELGFFWATKIGGPSHGFDVEGQCLLPLVANARHKVILVSDPAYPHHPVGRAHFRLLAFANSGKPVLWLETTNTDFRARVNSRPYPEAVLRHAMRKADEMGVPLSLEAWSEGMAQSIVSQGDQLRQINEPMLLRASNGVVEASDYLSGKHDWVQLEDETTGPMRRVLYIPGNLRGMEL